MNKFKMDLQKHAATFDPANVLLQDARTGNIPSEEGTLVLKEFIANSVVS